MHSGHVRFLDFDKQNNFIDNFLSMDEKINIKAYPSRTHPEVIFENVTHTEKKKILEFISKSGEWIENDYEEDDDDFEDDDEE